MKALVISAMALLAIEVESSILIVSGDANIFGAGHSIPPNPGGGSGGTLPPGVGFSASAGQVLTFSSLPVRWP